MRELIILGTASQVPTRTRTPNGRSSNFGRCRFAPTSFTGVPCASLGISSNSDRPLTCRSDRRTRPTCGHHLVQVAALGPAVDDHVARLIEAHQVELTRPTLKPARPKAQPCLYTLPLVWPPPPRRPPLPITCRPDDHGTTRRTPATPNGRSSPADTGRQRPGTTSVLPTAGRGRRDPLLDRTGCQWAALPADFPHPKLRANYTITRRWQPGMDSDERARAVAAWRSGVDRTLGLTRPIGTA
jgi:hypothetical protein